VVRYFGGTLLGVPGLIQAYKEASLEAFEAAEIIEIEPMDDLEIRFSYPQMNEIMKVIKKYPIQIVEQEVNNDCWYKLRFPHRIYSEVQSAFESALETY
jgi:putative IMPACT (imprinted ancient) family translation regulator